MEKPKEYRQSDLVCVRARLEEGGASVVLCRGGVLTQKNGRGIRPLLELIESGQSFAGAAAADTIVGRAAALLFLHMGVGAVYGKVMSRGAFDELNTHGVAAVYETLTENILNREGTGSCPMEAAVCGVFLPQEAYERLRKRADELKRAQEGMQ